MLKNVLSYHNTTLPNTKSRLYRISGIIRGRKVSRITFFTIVREKTFVIQAVSYIKTPAEIKKSKKTFANASRFANFANFFFRGRFPIYGI